ncbi:ComEC/Rec2 family competence protein [Microbispora sp. H10949]|uniref:ComEC/Rec2 family competence protein n=1 Tax=Microbispora sp. H10949 TaxID=2729111 RepID=UPI0016039EB6|nr:hypothetical protein [Microbispora sp. H10949]
MAVSARLEIHQINVGQGDSTLIVNRDLGKVADAIQATSGLVLPSEKIDYVPYAIQHGVSLDGTVAKALLIDGGDDEYGGDVIDYLRAHGVLEGRRTGYLGNLTVLVSHHHDDHMAGLRSLFKQQEPASSKAKGGKAPGLTARYQPGAVFHAGHFGVRAPASARYDAFLKDLDQAQTIRTRNRTVVHTLTTGGLENGVPAVIDLGAGADDIPIRVRVLAAAQGVYDPAIKQVTEIRSVGSAVDQNDRSVVVMVEYGSFRYFAGGDIAGNGGPQGGNIGQNAMQKSGKRYYSVHADVESVLGPVLESAFPMTQTYTAGVAKYPWPGYCTVMKANHHGSSSSMDVHLLATLRPLIVLISSGVKARFHRHPTPEVMRRLAGAWTDRKGKSVPNSVAQVYLTEVASRVRSKAFATQLGTARVLGDIVVRPVDETVTALQKATASGGELKVQVYGTGVSTTIYDRQTSLWPTETVKSQDRYPIGPWMHTDTH